MTSSLPLVSTTVIFSPNRFCSVLENNTIYTIITIPINAWKEQSYSSVRKLTNIIGVFYFTLVQEIRVFVVNNMKFCDVIWGRYLPLSGPCRYLFLESNRLPPCMTII